MFIENNNYNLHSTPAGVVTFIINYVSINIPTLRVEVAEIDQMVYQFYGLTDEEIQLMEKG